MIGLFCSLALAIGPYGLVEGPRAIPPVNVATRQDLNDAAERRQRGELPQPLDADAQRRFDAYKARISYLFSLTETAPTMEQASKLDNELYADMGVPYLNGRWQDMVIDQIEAVAGNPQAGEEIVVALRQTLLEYLAAGGGSASPPNQVNLARVLAIVGGPEHPECDQNALALCDKAERWANDLGSSSYISITEDVAKDVRDTISWQPRSAGGLPKPSPQVQRELSMLDTAIRAMSLVENVTPVQVEKAANVTAGLKGGLQVDAVSRLLISFQGLLTERRNVSKSVVQTIDKKLIWLAKDAKILSTQEHWSLWSDDVAAIGRNRASKELERFVHETEKLPPSEIVGAAMKRAANGLRRE